jgi:dynein heavy chain, axonemal
VYARIPDITKLQRIVEDHLENYNSTTSCPMKLVLFADALEHVARVCRVTKTPLGHSLLLGVGGSGRQSLARLAAHIEDFECFSIEISKQYGPNEWRDDLRKVLKAAGIEGRDIIFLFTDTQIVWEGMLEDINNLLNAGEVPNLMKPDDGEEIAAALRPLLVAEGVHVTRGAIDSLFVARVRARLHLVLAMSPIGDVFRQRLRMFPALVNCCTIDWFMEWPLEALQSVAQHFYSVRFSDLVAVILMCVCHANVLINMLQVIPSKRKDQESSIT